MKKYLLLLLFIPLVSFGQTKFEYYESGAIKFKQNYVDGKLQGEMILYYESGTIRAKGNYVCGIKDGKRIRYNKSGEVVDEVNYVDGKPQKN